MRAAVARRFGPPSVLTIEPAWRRPVRAAGQVLVEVHASSINPIDVKVPGRDFAGTVLESEPNSGLPPGTRVWGFVAYPSPGLNRQLRIPASGAYAEVVAVPAAHVARMPAGLSFDQAAALPLVATTAWQALEALRLQRGQRVLIHAGAGGVGSVAIQMAKARGLEVATTCSTRNLAFVTQELGADEAVDYRELRFEEALSAWHPDGVIDPIAGDYEARSMRLLRPSGAIASILSRGRFGAGMWGSLAGAAQVVWSLAKGKLLHMLGWGPRYHLVVVAPDGTQLAAVGRLVEEGRLRPFLDRVLPLERISEAMEHVEQGHTRGKVVVRIKDEPAAAAGARQ